MDFSIFFSQVGDWVWRLQTMVGGDPVATICAILLTIAVVLAVLTAAFDAVDRRSF